ncbi:dihydrofolate reductase family protein [Streptomyces sp. BA2]|uniref:dihydrofolate reductase family protein n=1 Tax=Streptomyces sp. BA2 TaxID=436595 RepID=UPI001324A902|nr:dihydrofolate reductase family protein [Streptomyces sp. BA2]MWA08215.1 hypothetical protein [Streptomyces sp. BA2]
MHRPSGAPICRTGPKNATALGPSNNDGELKQEDGKDIWLCGGGELAGVLFSEIDQLVVKLAPMAIGSGTPLFGEKRPFDPTLFALADSKIMESGTIFLTYAKKRVRQRDDGIE